jgi:myo-inositol-1(or 4)-monophosphatase
MVKELATAIRAAKAAGKFQKERYRSVFQVYEKAPANLVTDIDIRSQQIILEELNSDFPDIPALAEEDKSIPESADTQRWIIDPLDGTTNYAHGYPFFAISIALERCGRIELGVIYAPILDELFFAVRGKGSFLNDKPIHVSQTNTLREAFLASGFPYDAWTNKKDNTQEWSRLVKKVVSMRCGGAAALDLCFVASGVLDGYWELDLEPWDMAAGVLIVNEAGGKVSLTNGEPFSPYKRSILATNPFIFENILSEMNGIECG